MSYVPVRAVQVRLWGKAVGVLAPLGNGTVAFQYDESFLRSGIQISPLVMPASTETYAFPLLSRSAYGGLPGVFADSLPDAWGRGLVDEWMRANGVPRERITSLDRLAYVGSRGMGALCYEPDRGPRRRRPSALSMREIVEAAQLALAGRLRDVPALEAAREIIRLGSSAGGAHAKAFVGYNPITGEIVPDLPMLPDGFEHWILKITERDRPWEGEAEFATYLRARAAGIDISESRLVEIDGLRHFLTRRFDRAGNRRHHVLTLMALRHLPEAAVDGRLSYDQLFLSAEELGLGYAAKEEVFRRMAFNVLADESDDHAKNFSFLLPEGGAWRRAPAYDLTGGVPTAAPADDNRRAWTNLHQLSVNGKRSDIGDDDLLAVADRFAIGTAPRVLREVREALSDFPPNG